MYIEIFLMMIVLYYDSVIQKWVCRRKTIMHNNTDTVLKKNLYTILKPMLTSAGRVFFPILALCCILHQPVALAAPEGGQVVAGQGNITKPTEQSTVIQQISKKLAIDWRSFNVGANELVQFKQPSVSASALNRIHDQNPSQIFGSIKANGKVILVNPNGIFFSPTATVNTNGLIASGLGIETNSYINEQYEFITDGEGQGIIVNHGVLKAATGGSVTLIGEAVQNQGAILAEVGQVNLVAGKQVTVDFDGDGLMQFAITKEVVENSQSLDAAVHNTGDIIAEGGSVLLTGKASKAVFNDVVNNTGLIRAGRIENKGGSIRLIAGGTENSLLNTGVLDARGYRGDGGNVTLQATGDVVTSNAIDVSATKVDSSTTIQPTFAKSSHAQHGDNSSIVGDGGTIHIESDATALVTEDAVVSATSDIGKGGDIKILGEKVGLFDQAVVDASGENGGGRILVGGDFQGQNTDIKNAQYTYVNDDVAIKADAKTSQDGGEIIIWSDQVTRFYGEISATGGIENGDGGFTEISGKQTLDYQGTVDLSAMHGEAGEILFDPEDITFVNTLTSTDNEAATTGFTPTAVPPDQEHAFIDEPTSSSIFNVDGNGVLMGVSDGTTITFQATNDITIRDDFTIQTATGADNVSIVLQAGNNIHINALLGLDGTGSADLTANDTSIGSVPTGMGSIMFDINGAINSVNGNVNLTVMDGTGSITDAANITSTAGDITLAINGTGGITQVIGSTINAGSGALTLNGNGAINLAGTLQTTTGLITVESGGLLTINNITTTSGAVRLTGMGITQDATVNAGTGALTLDGSGDAINLAGTLITRNESDTALQIINATEVNLGGVAVGTFDMLGNLVGTLVLGRTGNEISGNVVQTGAIAAGTLTGNTGGTVTLNNPSNQIGSLGDFTSAGGFTLEETGGLTLTGALEDTSDDISLTTTGALTISATINNTGHNLSLTAVGVEQTAPLPGESSGIRAANASVDGGTGAIALNQMGNDFTGDVMLTSMGPSIGIVDTNDLQLTSLMLGTNTELRVVAGDALTLSGGSISTGTGDIDLMSGSALTISNGLQTSTGLITVESGGLLTVNDITTTSGAVSLTGGGITQAIGSTVNAGTGALTLDGNGDAITLLGTLRTENTTATALRIINAARVSLGIVNLVDMGGMRGTLVLGTADPGERIAGDVVQTMTSRITAGTLTGNAGGQVTLNNAANDITRLGDFTSVGGFSLVDTGGLTLAGALANTTGNISLRTDGTLALDGFDITNTTNTMVDGVVLAGMRITQGAGSTVDAGGGTLTLNGNGDAITLEGTLSTQNTGATALRIINATEVSVGTVNVSGGTLVLGGAGTNNISSTVMQSGVIEADTLTGNTGGQVMLENTNNEIENLAAFTSMGGFSLEDTGGLTLAGALENTTGDISLRTDRTLALAGFNITNITNTMGDGVVLAGMGITQDAGSTVDARSSTLTLNGNGDEIDLAGTLRTQNTGATALRIINATTVSLVDVAVGAFDMLGNLVGTLVLGGAGTNNISGDVVQTMTNRITAGTLTGNTGGQVMLKNTNNQIGNLDAFTSAGGFTLADTGGLTVTGALTDTSDDISLTTTGALTISAAINNTGHNLTLSGMGVEQTGGAIQAEDASITSTTGLITLNRPNNDFTGDVMLTSMGPIDIVDTNDLTLTSLMLGTNTALRVVAGGALTLPGGNISTGTGDIDLMSGSALTISNGLQTSTGDISLASTTGLLTINDITTNSGTVSLTGAGITQGMGAITARTLTGSSSGQVTLGNTNQIDNLGNFTSAGGFTLVDTGGLRLTGALANTTGNISLTIAGITQGAGSTVDAGGGTLILNSNNNAIDLAGRITANTLTGGSGGQVTLDNASNQIARLGNFTSVGGFTLENTGNLTFAGTLANTTGDISLSTAGLLALEGFNITNNMGTSTMGTSVSLTGASITQGIGSMIMADTLTGSSGGQVTLGNTNNQISNLGAFTSVGGFSLVNTGSLALTGALEDTSGDIRLTTTGALTISAAINNAGNNLTLEGMGVEQTGGAIQAEDASITSTTGLITLNRPNNDFTGDVMLTSMGPAIIVDTNDLTLTSLMLGTNTALRVVAGGALTLPGGNISTGTGDIDLMSGSALTISNGLQTSTGDISLASTTGLLTINDNITTASGAVSLTGAGITQGMVSTVNAGTGALTLDGNDGAITLEGTLRTQNTTATALQIIDATTVSLLGAVNVSDGTLVLGGAGNDNISSTVMQRGVIEADTLTGNTGGQVTLENAGNEIDNLAAFTSADGFSLKDTGGLRLTGALRDTTGDISLTTTTNALALERFDITATGVSLTGAGITQGASSTVNAGTGALTLDGNGDAITLEGTLSTENTTATALRIINAMAVGADPVAVSLGTVNVGVLDMAGTLVSGMGGTVVLGTTNANEQISGSVVQTGAIQAGTLIGNTGGQVTLGNAGNQIDNLAAFTSAGGFSLVDTGGLTLTGELADTMGAISLSTDGALSINQNINATGQTLTLSGASITQGMVSVITADTLGGSASGQVTLENAGNQIDNLGTFTSAGGFSLVDTGGLRLTGALTDTTGAISLTTTTNALALERFDITGTGVSLTGMGITQGMGSTVNAGTGALTLDGNDGVINLAGTLSTNNNGATALQIIDAMAEAADPVAVSLGTVNVSRGALVLGTAVTGDEISGNVVQTGIITAGTLTGNTGGEVTLRNTNNQIGNLAAFTSAGGFSLVNTGGLTVTGALEDTSDDISLTTTGALTISAAINNTGHNLTLSGMGVEQTGGAIQAEDIIVDGGTGAIALNQMGNDFTGNAMLTSLGLSIDIVDTNDLQLTSLMLGTNTELRVVAGGALTLPGGNISTGTGDIDLMSGSALTISNGLQTSTGDISLASTTGLLTINDITTNSGTVSLTGAGITQGMVSTVNAGTGALTLDGNDGAITLEGTLRTQNTTATALQIIDATTVSLLGAVNVSDGTLVLGGAGNDNISSTVMQSGVIEADTLAGNTGGQVMLENTNNQITRLGAFTSAGGFALADTGGLTLTGALTDTTGAISLTTTTNALALEGFDITGTGVSLTGAGITQGVGSTVDAGTGALTLDGNGNAIDLLGTLRTENTGATALRIINAARVSLGIVNLVDMGGMRGTLVLGTADPGERIAGDVVQTMTSRITAGTLTGNAGGQVTLDNAGNQIDNLAAFTSAGGFTLVETGGLTLADALTDTTGAISLTTTGGTLALEGFDITATGVSLTGMGITQGMGSTVNARGGALELDGNTGVVNLAGTLQTTTGLITVESGGLLTINDINTNSGAVSLTGAGITQGAGSTVNAGTGTLELDGNTGAINLAGIITAGTLTGNTGGIVTLNNTSNQIGNLAAFTSAGGFTLADTGGLAVTGALTDTSDNISLTTTGAALTIGAAINNAGNNLSLTAVGVEQTAPLPGEISGIRAASASVDGGTGAITLDQAGNDFTGTINLAGSDATVTDINSLILGNISITGALTVNIDGDNNDMSSLDFSSATFNTGIGINLNAQGDNDTLLALDTDNNWTITALNQGRYQNSAITADFAGFANLIGNTMSDTFTVNDTAGISGIYDGGTGNDTIVLTPYTTAATVTLSGLGNTDGMRGQINAGATGIGDFDNIEVIIGTGNPDTLTGLDMDATWTIDGNTTGLIGGITTERYAAGGRSLDFSNGFSTLSGGNLADTFNISADYAGSFSGVAGNDTFNVSGSAMITGDLDGGGDNDTFNVSGSARITGTLDGGSGSDQLDTAGYLSVLTLSPGSQGTIDGVSGSVTLDDGSTIAIFDNIDSLMADPNSGSRLRGRDLDTIWTIDGINSGMYNFGTGPGDTLSFTGFNSILGGTASDTFVFTTGVVSEIDGGSGTGIDTVVTNTGMGETFNLTGDGTGNISNIGGSAVTVEFASMDNIFADFNSTTNDTFNIEDVAWGGVIAAGLGQDTLNTIHANASDWTLTGTGTRPAIHGIAEMDMDAVDGTSGSVNSSDFLGIETINDFATKDTFTAIDIFNVQSVDAALTINGRGGNDIFNVFSTSNTINQIAATLTLDGGGGDNRLNLIDSGNTNANTGTLSNPMAGSSRITGFGFGLGGEIDYSSMNDVDLTLGSGDNTVNVDGTSASVTINTGAGDDIINVGDATDGTTNIASVLTVDGGGDSITGDRLNINNQAIGTDTDYVFATSEISITHDTSPSVVAEISYNAIEQLDVNLGTAVDNISVSAWDASIANITDAGGQDSFEVTGSFTITDDFTITGIETITSQAGAFLAATQLSINNAESIGSMLDAFLADIDALQITNSGMTNIQARNDVQLLGINTGGGDFALATNDGSITSMGSTITTTGNVFLTAGGVASSIGTVGNFIELDNVAQITAMAAQGAGGIFLHQTTGDLNVASADADTGAITLMSGAALTAGALDGDILTTNSVGSSVFDGAINVMSADITATTINLNNPLMSTGLVEITNSGLFATNSAAMISANGGFSASGDVQLANDIITTNTDIAIGGSLQIASDVALSTGTNGGGIGIDGDIYGTAGGATESLRLESGTGFIGSVGDVNNIDIFGVIGAAADPTGLTTVTISSADSVKFGRINITGDLNVSNVNTPVILQENIDIGGSSIFENINALLLGDNVSDIFNFNGGIEHISDSTDIMGTINTIDSAVTFANVNLLSDTTISTAGAGNIGNTITLADVDHGGFSLNLNAGGSAAIDIGSFLEAGMAAGMTLAGSLEIMDSAGAIFSGMVLTDSIILGSSSGEVQFISDVDTNTLAVNNGAYSVTFLEDLTVNNGGVIFGGNMNTAVTLGDSSNDIYNFNGIVDITGPQAINLAGTFMTNSDFRVRAFDGSGNDVSITADEIDFTGGASITDVGVLTLSQFSDIGVIIGDTNVGNELNISSADITALENSATNIIIGRDGIGMAQLGNDINVGTANLELHAEQFTFISDTILTAENTTLNAPIFDDVADNVTFNGSVELNGTVNNFNASTSPGVVLHDGWDVGNLTFNSDTLTVNDYVLLEATGAISYPATITTSMEGSALAIVPLEGAEQFIGGTDAMAIPVAPFAGYSGHLIIGGSVEEIETVEGMADITSIDINAEKIILSGAGLTTQGPITFLAGDQELGADITNTGTDNRIILLAAANATGFGIDPGTTAEGIIEVNNNITISGATEHIFVAVTGITNARDLNVVTPGGIGTVEVASRDDTIQFGLGSRFESVADDARSLIFDRILTIFANGNIGSLTVTEVQILNPAADLLGQEAIGFIDIGLFEEDLTLFGQIGTGIALSLNQCEEIEGCAPNVTLEELDQLIAQLEVRLEELEHKLNDSTDTNEESTLQDLYAGYQQELAEFTGYRETLQAYFAFSEEDDDFADEFLDQFADQSGSIYKLGIALEIINARIQWLEGLKDRPQQRDNLKEAIGTDVTQEVLQDIIESTEAEIRFIERQIKLLQEGTQAAINTVPLFIAEVGNDKPSQNINYADHLNSYQDHSW